MIYICLYFYKAYKPITKEFIHINYGAGTVLNFELTAMDRQILALMKLIF